MIFLSWLFPSVSWLFFSNWYFSINWYFLVAMTAENVNNCASCLLELQLVSNKRRPTGYLIITGCSVTKPKTFIHITTELYLVQKLYLISADIVFTRTYIHYSFILRRSACNCAPETPTVLGDFMHTFSMFCLFVTVFVLYKN